MVLLLYVLHMDLLHQIFIQYLIKLFEKLMLL